MKLAMIACVGKNLELGRNNDLIWHLPSDLKYFKEVTLGHTVIMGRNTFKSLPGVLKNRHNIVLTFKEDKDELPDEVEVLHSINEFLDKYKEKDELVFVIGGTSIYKQFIDLADTLYLTEVDGECKADVYFPEFDKSLYTKEIVGNGNDNNIKFNFVIYRRI